jgi:LAO/AO transport system kinase
VKAVPPASRPDLSPAELAESVLAGNRTILARAITLVESRAPHHRARADALLSLLLPRAGNAIRLGITGVPGAGKSTFIDALGIHLVSSGHRVAVLAVDPTSQLSGGSILGDKTRMARLANHPAAFVRPQPSGGSLGGVARRTRETMLLCEAAGFDVILVETVGVGQSETVVAEMTDTFLAIALSGAGDELQGIKRGLLELVDIVAINKADGANATRAEATARELRSVLQLVRHGQGGSWPPVVPVSALEERGIVLVWEHVLEHRRTLETTGALTQKRAQQALRWMWNLIEGGLRDAFVADPQVKGELPALERGVRAGEVLPTAAAEKLLAAFRAPAIRAE